MRKHVSMHNYNTLVARDHDFVWKRDAQYRPHIYLKVKMFACMGHLTYGGVVDTLDDTCYIWATTTHEAAR